MEIIKDNPKLKCMDLKIGEVFEYESDFYIKTDQADFLNDEYEAVNLRTGSKIIIKGPEDVILCMAKLHINKII